MRRKRGAPVYHVDLSTRTAKRIREYIRDAVKEPDVQIWQHQRFTSRRLMLSYAHRAT